MRLTLAEEKEAPTQAFAQGIKSLKAIFYNPLVLESAMVRLSVHGLDAQELCKVECEKGVLGRQLKEAIEEATAWQELVCTQSLAIGGQLIADHEPLSDVADGASITLTRRPLPEKVLQAVPGEQRKSLALALRHFDTSAVLVQVPMHGYAFGIPCQEDKAKALYKDMAQGVEEDEVQFLDLDASSWQSVLPWDEMGVPFQEILAVLSLQSDCMLIGDGLSEASGCVLLLDGSLVAFAAFLDEADSRVNYSSSCVCARDSAKTCEELWKKYPGFMILSCSVAPFFPFLFPKASLMLGFCFRFSLKVPGSDTSCDDGDKKGFPFRCAADRACDAGWGCRPGVRGWLGGRRCGAGWVRETGAVDARDRRKPPPSETGAGHARDRRKPPPSETGAVDARGMRKPPASETGAVDARDKRKPPPSETGARDTRDRPRARRARGTLVTGRNRPRARRS